MNKIRVIGLLNKIANGERVPKKIKFKDYEYIFHNNYNGYYRSVVESNWIGLTTDFSIIEILNDTVEIIEEQQDIDIQTIKGLEYLEDYEVDKTDVRLNRELINKILKWAKQLDKNIKDKE